MTTKPQETARPAILYVRFSSKAQDEIWGGTSKERQLTDGRRYAATHNLRLLAEFSDDGVSAKDGKNWERGLRQAINALPQGGILLVEMDSRFSRQNAIETLHFMLTEVCRPKSATVIYFATGAIHTEESLVTTGGGLTAFVGSAGAHQDNLVRRNAVAKSVRIRKEAMAQGERKGTILPPWLRSIKNDRNRVIDYRKDDTAAALVNNIFDLYLAGNGALSICAILNKGKVAVIGRKKAVKTWCPTFITRLIKNKAVIGLCPFLDSAPAIYPPIMPEDKFYRAQAMLDNRRIARGPKTDNPSIFGGNVFCAKCGAPMHRHIHKKGAAPKLICSNAQKGKCGFAGMHYQRLENATLYLLTSDEILSRLLSAEEKQGVKTSETVSGQIKSKQEQVANITEKVLAGLASNALVKAQIQLEADIETLKEQRERAIAEEKTNTLSNSLAALNALASSIEKEMHSPQGLARIRVRLTEVFEKISVDVSTGKVEWTLAHLEEPYKTTLTESFSLWCRKQVDDKWHR